MKFVPYIMMMASLGLSSLSASAGGGASPFRLSSSARADKSFLCSTRQAMSSEETIQLEEQAESQVLEKAFTRCMKCTDEGGGIDSMDPNRRNCVSTQRRVSDWKKRVGQTTLGRVSCVYEVEVSADFECLE